MFMGNRDFKEVMGRARFKQVRATFCTYPHYDLVKAAENPKKHSDTVLEHLAKNCSSIAVPIGVTSLDENSVRCKGGRTSVRSYIKRKPVSLGSVFMSSSNRGRHIYTRYSINYVGTGLVLPSPWHKLPDSGSCK